MSFGCEKKIEKQFNYNYSENLLFILGSFVYS